MQTEAYYIRCATEHADNPVAAKLFLGLAKESRRLRDLRVQEVADFMEAHERPSLLDRVAARNAYLRARVTRRNET